MIDLDAPRVSGLVQDDPHLGVDDVTAGQGLIQFQVTDEVSQGGGGQVLNGSHGVFHAVGVQLGVGDLEEQNSVHLDGDIILGDDRLRGEVCDLFLQGDLASDPFDEGDL